MGHRLWENLYLDLYDQGRLRSAQSIQSTANFGFLQVDSKDSYQTTSMHRQIWALPSNDSDQLIWVMSKYQIFSSSCSYGPNIQTVPSLQKSINVVRNFAVFWELLTLSKLDCKIWWPWSDYMDTKANPGLPVWCFVNSVSQSFVYLFKGSIFLKNRHFIIQERFNKLKYGINTIIKCGTWQPVKFQSIVLEIKWFFLSYLWINVANINSEIR